MKSISILIPTFNRLNRLVQCINSVWETISMWDEVIIWNNASTDGTKEFLDRISKHGLLNIRIINSETNIGLSAVNRGFRMMKHEYLVKIDDDVIDIPFVWKEKLLEVFQKVPKAGYISAALRNDEHLPQNFFKDYENPEIYKRETINGIPLRIGSASGGFVMTTKQVFDDLGGFADLVDVSNTFYFNEDADYSERCKQKGYITGFREDLEIFHAFGPYYNRDYKQSYILKYRNWISQPGFKSCPKEEKKNYLRQFSVNDEEILEEILK